jgi:hypothetical protein
VVVGFPRVAQKIMWSDQYWASVGGGRASIECDEGAAIGYVHPQRGPRAGRVAGWYLQPGSPRSTSGPSRRVSDATRDLYIPPDDIGFCRRASTQTIPARAPEAVAQREPVSVWPLYSDHDGGQRTITASG